MKKMKIGISIGDINGIGMEVIIKTFRDARMLDMCTPIVYGSSKISSFHSKALEINDFSFNKIKNAKEAKIKKANIIECLLMSSYMLCLFRSLKITFILYPVMRCTD